jgi:O-antigen/teichoic acid export membrane protein
MERSEPSDAIGESQPSTDGASFSRNVSWTALSMLLRVGIAGGTLAVLSHIVAPATMGLYGIGWAMAMLGYTVSQNGAAQSIIALPDMEREHIAAAQLLSFAISFAIGAIIFAAGPLMARFYVHPGVAEAFAIAGIFVPIMNFGAVDVALAQKELAFSRLAMVQTGGVILSSLTALALAFAGYGLLALYALQGFVGLFNFVLFRFIRLSPGFGQTTRRHVSDIGRIGVHLSFGSLTGALWQSVPQLVLAKVVSVEALGLFVFCSRIIQLVFAQLSGMINSVAYPTFAKLRANPADVGQAYLKVVPFTFACLMLPLVVLAAAPDSFLSLYGGSQWVPAASILFYLALMQMALSLGANAFPTFQALGKPSVVWRWNLFITFVQGTVILLAAPYGITAVVQGLAISALVMPLAVLWLSRMAQFRYSDYWWRMLPMIVPVLPAFVAGKLGEQMLGGRSVLLAFLFAATVALTVYVFFVLILDREARYRVYEGLRKLSTRPKSADIH